jgi:hypothetical protein
MHALLRQQGLVKILEPFEERIGITAIDEIVECAELEEKAHNFILLSLSDGVLRKVAIEETAVGLWKKLESLYMKKSLTNHLGLVCQSPITLPKAFKHCSEKHKMP